MTTIFRARVTAVDNGWLTQAPSVAGPYATDADSSLTNELPAPPAGIGDGGFMGSPAGPHGPRATAAPPATMFLVSSHGHAPHPAPPAMVPWALREQFHLTVDGVLGEMQMALHLNRINWGEASKVIANVSEQIAPSITIASLDHGFIAVTCDPRDAAPRAPGVMVMPDVADEPWKEAPQRRPARTPRALKRMGFETEEQLLAYVQDWIVEHQDWAQEHDREAGA